MRQHPFEKAELRKTYSKQPAEEFMIGLVHDLRTPTIEMSEHANLILNDIESGKEIDLEKMKRFVLTVIERTTDLFNICEAAVEYDQIQKDRRNIQSDQ